jgi:hypothetical protein
VTSDVAIAHGPGKTKGETPKPVTIDCHTMTTRLMPLAASAAECRLPDYAAQCGWVGWIERISAPTIVADAA